MRSLLGLYDINTGCERRQHSFKRVLGYPFDNYHKLLRCNLYTKLPKY